MSLYGFACLVSFVVNFAMFVDVSQDTICSNIMGAFHFFKEKLHSSVGTVLYTTIALRKLVNCLYTTYGS